MCTVLVHVFYYLNGISGIVVKILYLQLRACGFQFWFILELILVSMQSAHR